MKPIRKILIKEFTIGIQMNYHIFFVLKNLRGSQPITPAHMIISHLPYCRFKNFLEIRCLELNLGYIHLAHQEQPSTYSCV